MQFEEGKTFLRQESSWKSIQRGRICLATLSSYTARTLEETSLTLERTLPCFKQDLGGHLPHSASKEQSACSGALQSLKAVPSTSLPTNTTSDIKRPNSSQPAVGTSLELVEDNGSDLPTPPAAPNLMGQGCSLRPPAAPPPPPRRYPARQRRPPDYYRNQI